jgi:DNA modification methylase
VFEVARPKRSDTHPTIKPVELIRSQLANSLRPGDGVLDPFAGSGSTLIAAELLGARALLVELDPAYCDVIRQRYADYTDRPELAP